MDESLEAEEEESAASSSNSGEIPRHLVRKAITKMIGDISLACSPDSGRTLKTFLQAPDQRRATWFKAQKFDVEHGSLVDVEDDRANMQRAQKKTAFQVMTEVLPGSDCDAPVDPKQARWIDLREPNLGDLAYGEARRGMWGVGDEVPAHSFLYRWVLCVTAALISGSTAEAEFKDVTTFPKALAQRILKDLLIKEGGKDVPTGMGERERFLGHQGVAGRRIVALACGSGTTYMVAADDSDHVIAVMRVMIPFPQAPVASIGEHYHHLTIFRCLLTTGADAGGELSHRRLSLFDLLAVSGASLTDLPVSERLVRLRKDVGDPLAAVSRRMEPVFRRAGFMAIEILGAPGTAV